MMETETPQSIYDTQTMTIEIEGVSTEVNRDIFYQGMADYTLSDFFDIMINALWSKYRYVGIGSCDVDYWVQCFADRFNLKFPGWTMRFRALFDMWYRVDGMDTLDLSTFRSGSDSTSRFYDAPDVETEGETPAEYLSTKTKGDNKQRMESGQITELYRSFCASIPEIMDEFTEDFRPLFFAGV